LSNSLSFNGTDLSTYGLIVTNESAAAFRQLVDFVQLPDAAYPFGATREAKSISLDIAITGSSYANVQSKLDAIKRILNQRASKHLILDVQDDRYYNAQFISLGGAYKSPRAFIGNLDFTCPDPVAHSTTETSSDFNINADPKTVTETTGGTDYIKPIYTLTAGEALNDVTIKVECVETEEELQWTGSLANTEKLMVDVINWIVRKEGSTSMATVVGQFPRLLPGITNHIKITGFGTTGALNISYRNCFL